MFTFEELYIKDVINLTDLEPDLLTVQMQSFVLKLNVGSFLHVYI